MSKELIEGTTPERLQVGDVIKNTKTGKMGIVLSNDLAGSYYIEYHLIGTPNCKHTCLKPQDRFIKLNKNKIK